MSRLTMGESLKFPFALVLCVTLVYAEKFRATMPGAYPQKADDYICTQIPLPQFKTENGYVSGFKAIVNDSVHHIIISACNEWMSGEVAAPPGPCDTQCRTHILYSWAHQGAPLILPEGSAFEIGYNTEIKSLSMEVHYIRREEKPDYATVELTYTRQPQPNRAGIILLYNQWATVPPHAEHFPTNISCRLRTRVPLRVIGVRTHAHDLNRGVYSYYYRPYDRMYHLIAKGNAQWPQTFYKPSQLSAGPDPIFLRNRDILMGRCVYDSTDRDRATEMGSTHADEMCNVYIMYIMDSRFDPPEPEMCADEMIPGIWDRAPAEAREYVTNIPPAPVSETSKPSLPRSIEFELDPDWSVRGARLGKVSAVALAEDPVGKTHLFVLLRGNNPWNEYSFDDNFIYSEPTAAYVPSPILHIDAESGKVFEAFGDDLLVLPHGLSIAKNEAGKPTALWVTDLAHHQVMKFSWNDWNKPSLVLGRHGKPGNDEKTFCQPTDVAIASTGEIFVADGYCNQRVVKFSPSGKYINEWGVGGVGAGDGSHRGFQIPHSITIVPATDGSAEQVCVADRERAIIDCYTLDGHRLAQYGGSVLQPSVYAITFSPIYELMFGVTGLSEEGVSIANLQADLDVEDEQAEEDIEAAFAFRPLLGPNATSISNGSAFKLITGRDHVIELDLRSPHDIEVSADGSMLFIAQLRPPYLSKVDIVKSGKKAGGSNYLIYSATPKTLMQKIFISSTLVIFCAVVVIIALVLFWSRKSRLWTLHNSSKLQRHRGGNRRSGWKRYDGFQPLQQEELQGLGSALESDEDEDLADSDTIVDIRKFGLTDAGTNHIHNSKFNHHVDT
ncbi:hypothetical protein Aperf_G00000041534 [Anoplocephala perfoliata]